MAISEDQVKHVARLAKLAFPDADLHQFTNQMSNIIDLFQELAEVDTTGVAVTSNVTDNVNVMRKDVAIPGMDRAELLRNAPESENGFIKVPAIIDNGEAGA